MLKTTGIEDKKTENVMELNCSDEDMFVVEVGSKITHKRLEGRKSLKRKSFGTRAGCIKQVVASYKEPPLKSLSPEIFKDESLTIGGQVKARGQVLKTREEARSRPPNTTCRVETFGRICQTFDERRTLWVVEMGFGGLLHFAGDMHLPRQLSYWLMSCIDPLNYTLRCADGRVFALSKNQVHWVLGIPNRGMCVPCYKSLPFARKGKVHEIMGRYGKAWSSKSNKTGRQYKSEGIPVDRKLMERVEGYWGEEDGDEFKMLFLLLSLEMLLCPTQSSRLASDLVPCLTCASEASEYDWCSLVLKKLMDSVATFARRFYASGYASGCGGCLIFAVVFYLDRLERQPVSWGLFPRIQAWTMDEIRCAVKEDRMPEGGDFGVFGSLDVAYGESHPLLARDTQGPDVEDPLALGRSRKRKMPTPRRVAMRKNLRQYRLRDERKECFFSHSLSSCHASNTRELNNCFNGRELVIDASFHDRIKRSICYDAAKAFKMVEDSYHCLESVLK
ncbi:uncharacterized protein LOC110701900 [Chenopodium quinoa]|uniref:uncharacterized protein LOC110701900 n=1 Tax=Chenopodium quinoa TaxID=63459 RepID=UPI000B77B6D9|nr:uncharacterized protein LOC110701900 [Chenopodium quinoa]